MVTASQVIAELRESRIVGESSPVWPEEVEGEGQRALGAMTRCRGDSAVGRRDHTSCGETRLVVRRVFLDRFVPAGADSVLFRRF